MSDSLSAASTPVVPDEVSGVAAATGKINHVPDGVALCLSGGGFRAMLFHLGGLVRLNQLGQLKSLRRVSSVSGGSLTAAMLGMHWDHLTWDASGVSSNLGELVVEPLMEFSKRNIDVRSFISGVFTPFKTVSDYVSNQYEHHLFHGATLQDLPDSSDGSKPRFVINATSVQTGKLVRFSRPYIADYTVGMWMNPTTSLADAVTASSAFPPVLSPHRIKPSGEFATGGIVPINGAAFRDELILTDGGVYDNLGLQTAWSSCATVLVSDGGQPLDANAKEHSDWARHGIRITEIIDSQVRALRKRQLIQDFEAGTRAGTYWGIASDIADYMLADSMTFDHQPATYPADVPTRLAAIDGKVGEDLVRWGYVICDTAMRKHVTTSATKPSPSDIPA